MNYFQTIRDAVILLALVVIPAVFLRANLRDPSELSWLDRALLQVSGPVQYVAEWAADGATSVIEDYVYLVDVKSDNDQLRAENSRIRREMRVLRGDAQRVHELESLLGLREQLATETMTARVIAKSISPSFRVVRLAVDQGEHAGLHAGMPVVSNEGLVGQIRRVSGRFADVLLTIDPESRVDVVVGEGRARGRIEGLGERSRYRCRIQFDRADDQVAVGDEVITSGLGKKFPASILIGYVSKIGEQEFGLHQEGEVTPSVDFTRLDEVLILTSGPKDSDAL
ncbi:MAG: rod shape-determining protein MreC [Deltaproteobacteria bacterium]|nr:rod shape-determining protein MreC [Deltaproteobacteria bacterium]MBW2210781.1 rod shape-determining protein MreC [Deltaproteobacteria bacterium]MBW2213970.1 rod shape-determining protein MreC [Deltaproteobacteria bacterium]MBW2379734.1 rod shape-determining protein MreC [Deltaproteobacteria bacterium]MBW2627923.1 rod shape-determining protein MreC [Deltaproteobacteria bacterium]